MSRGHRVCVTEPLLYAGWPFSSAAALATSLTLVFTGSSCSVRVSGRGVGSGELGRKGVRDLKLSAGSRGGRESRAPGRQHCGCGAAATRLNVASKVLL